MSDTTTELEVLDQIVEVLGGTSGQYETVVPVLQQIYTLLEAGITDPEAIAEAVHNELVAHPEWTTTVQDGSITNKKLAADVREKVEAVDEITDKMQLVHGHNWCEGDSSMTAGYVDLAGQAHTYAGYKYSKHVPVSEGEQVRAFGTYNGSFVQMSIRFMTAYDAGGNAVAASGNENIYVYTVPSGVASVVISVLDATDYMFTKNIGATAYEQYVPPYYVATDAYLGTAADGKVDRGGTWQVRTGNIEGFTSVGGYVQSDNIFDADWFYSLGYPYVNALGELVIYNNDNLSTFIMPVNGGIYNFTNVRFAVKLLSDKKTAVGGPIDSPSSIDTTGASWLAFGFNPTTYPLSTYSVTESLPVYAIPPNWQLVSAKRAYGRVTGELADGGTLGIAGRSAIKDGQTIVFKGHLTSFGSISLNFTNTSTVTNYVQVDATNVTIKNANTAMAPVAHGLTIQNDICIMVEFANGQAKVTITSNGESFTTTVGWYQSGGTATQPQVASTGTVCDVATLESVYPAAKRKVWLFGDSYIGFGVPERWPYYLVADGLSDNGLFSGSAGATSLGAKIALAALLTYGTPDVAVLATGMNDGSDGDAPSSRWSPHRDAFLTLCEQNGITPIFCTIPTVPTVNNEKKNAWVRASGYRYIDFAAAVGANASGEWYAGMLSSDNVHPSAKGARALYSQVLADLPEIFIPA